ncbi:hypothetical protein ACFWA5_49805 [Streptomyces mirabilis]
MLTEHLRAVAAPSFNVEDLEAPRANVLVRLPVGERLLRGEAGGRSC